MRWKEEGVTSLSSEIIIPTWSFDQSSRFKVHSSNDNQIGMDIFK